MKEGLDAVTSGLSYECCRDFAAASRFPAFAVARQVPLPTVGGVAQVVRATVS
jgi:hypothetical protein